MLRNVIFGRIVLPTAHSLTAAYEIRDSVVQGDQPPHRFAVCHVIGLQVLLLTVTIAIPEGGGRNLACCAGGQRDRWLDELAAGRSCPSVRDRPPHFTPV